MTQKGRVSPFGDPRIKGCSPLPAAFRSVPRPSSPLSAKASTKCPYALDPKPAAACRDKSPARPRASIRHSALHLPAWPTPAGPMPRTQKPHGREPPPSASRIPIHNVKDQRPGIRHQGSEDPAPGPTPPDNREQESPRPIPDPWHLSSPGGADRSRTGDPLLAKQALSQLSYGPKTRCQMTEVRDQRPLIPDPCHLTSGGGPGKI